MSSELWLAFLLLAVVSSITPGPNNLLLLASGLQAGILGTLPLLLGINLGFLLMFGLVVGGLGQVFIAVPWMQTALKVVGTVYFLWLAWRFVGDRSEHPLPQGAGRGLLQGAALQVVNPKAWVMCITVASLYLPPEAGLRHITLMLLTFTVVGLPANLLWLLAGDGLRRLSGPSRRRRVFNRTMAVLLVLSILPVWTGS